MKQYLITEEDIERLRKAMDCGSDSDWWYEARIDDWAETLVTQEETIKARINTRWRDEIEKMWKEALEKNAPDFTDRQKE